MRPAPFLLALLLTAPAAARDRAQDARIEAAARRTFAFRVHLREDAVEVQARNGVVTLTGTVSDGFHRTLAEETVAGLPGVRSVENRLKVRPDAPAEASDAWLAARIRAALRYRRDLRAERIDVEVREGVATLSGSVPTAQDRDRAGAAVREVEGVREVRNTLTVDAAVARPLAERLDDATITAQVKVMLLFRRGTRTLATRVATDRGTVTLRGTARTPAERRLAGQVARDVQGVRRVINRMTVAPEPSSGKSGG